MENSPDMGQPARAATAYDKGATTATAVASLTGVVAFVAWAYYIALAGGAEPSTATVATATFVFAAVATAFCAAFAGAWLVLDTLHRAHSTE